MSRKHKPSAETTATTTTPEATTETGSAPAEGAEVEVSDQAQATGEVEATAAEVPSSVVDRLLGGDKAETVKITARRRPVTQVPLLNVAPMALPEWDVSVPADITIKPIRVSALTKGDAEVEFRRRKGIISCGHPIQVHPASAG